MMLKFKTHLNNKNKEWITFVHGFGGSSSIWYKQVKELSKYYNLLLNLITNNLYFLNHRVQSLKIY